MKHIIAITLSHDKNDLIRENVEYSYIRREYGESVKLAGAEPIFTDSSVDPETIARLVSGVVISGGADIDPRFYGEDNIYNNQLEPSERTEWEKRLIDACDRHRVPILGVCYGSQLLNVHYGGSLYQDILTQGVTSAAHGSSDESAMKDIVFSGEFLGFSDGDRVVAAHRHHQSIARLAEGFDVMAAAEDGVIEAIAGNGHFGIQWHAESDGTADKIYASFVEYCRQVRVNKDSRDSAGIKVMAGVA